VVRDSPKNDKINVPTVGIVLFNAAYLLRACDRRQTHASS